LARHLQEEIVGWESLRKFAQKIRRIPQRSLTSRLEIHRASALLMLKLHLEAFHIREQRF
jgi:hypothetical protein